MVNESWVKVNTVNCNIFYNIIYYYIIYNADKGQQQKVVLFGYLKVLSYSLWLTSKYLVVIVVWKKSAQDSQKSLCPNYTVSRFVLFEVIPPQSAAYNGTCVQRVGWDQIWGVSKST